MSFTKETGEEHLGFSLGARAVENGCYVIAAAQTGVKPAYTAYGEQYAHRSLGKGPGTGRTGNRGLLWRASIWIMSMRSAAGCRPWKAGGRTCTRWRKKESKKFAVPS